MKGDNVDQEEWSRYDDFSEKREEEELVAVWERRIWLEKKAGQRSCLLVLAGATADGLKEFFAVVEGSRERKQSWYALLVDLGNRGLALALKRAMRDGASGIWKVVVQVFPTTRTQRCRVRRTANKLDKLPN